MTCMYIKKYKDLPRQHEDHVNICIELGRYHSMEDESQYKQVERDMIWLILDQLFISSVGFQYIFVHVYIPSFGFCLVLDKNYLTITLIHLILTRKDNKIAVLSLWSST